MKSDNREISREVVKRLKARHGVELLEELEFSINLSDEIPCIVRDVLDLTR